MENQWEKNYILYTPITAIKAMILHAFGVQVEDEALNPKP